LKQYVKFITGYIAQKYVKKGKKYACISQNFIAKGAVSREDESGSPISIDSRKEVEFPYNMKQPK
jgi:hypothetical protein